MTPPRTLRCHRNAVRPNETRCEAFSFDIPAGHAGPVSFGRVVTVPALTFDEYDAAKILKLAAWLVQAAEWISLPEGARRDALAN